MINQLPKYNLSSRTSNNCRLYLINLRKIVKCGICGHKQKIQFHHIKPTKLNGDSRGLNRRTLDIMNHPDCYLPLCYFCHQKVTSKELFIIPHSNAYGWITLWWSIQERFNLDWIGASDDDKLGLINVI